MERARRRLLASLIAVAAAAAVAAIGTYIAEAIVYRRTLARMRSTGEPWAYRDT